MIASVRLSSPRSTAAWASLAMLAHARDHRHDLADRAHLLDLLELVEHVLEGEARLAELLLHLLRLVDVEGLLGPLDERQDVAHPQDPAGEPVGMEELEGIGLLAGAEELDGEAR